MGARTSKVIRFEAHARAFLRRAREHIARFDDEGDSAAAGLLYAALELRYGIEARLYDYLRATYKQLGRAEPTGHEGKKLLAELLRAAPDAGRPSIVTWWREDGSGEGGGMRYTPVTPELARDHGKLGGLLHYRYFLASRGEWQIRIRTPGRPRTLLDWRDYLADVADRLADACAGTMLTHVRFTELVERLTDERPSDE